MSREACWVTEYAAEIVACEAMIVAQLERLVGLEQSLVLAVIDLLQFLAHADLESMPGSQRARRVQRAGKRARVDGIDALAGKQHRDRLGLPDPHFVQGHVLPAHVALLVAAGLAVADQEQPSRAHRPSTRS